MALPIPSLPMPLPHHLEDTAEPTQGQLSELPVYSGTHGCKLWKGSGSRCSEGHVGVWGWESAAGDLFSLNCPKTIARTDVTA